MLDKGWKPYVRDEETQVRFWAKPGTEGFMHRLGGLERITGRVRYLPIR
ncbi:MAG: hypothetical protein ACLRRG_04660 [Barnesiella sp.]